MDKDEIEQLLVKAGISMYFAIIGNIIESMNNREHFSIEARLKEVLGEINQKYAAEVAIPFVITTRNEFQGLLSDSLRILEIIDRVRIGMESVDIRFGIGIGDIARKIDNHLSAGNDGPAYWNAREAIIEMSRGDDYGKTRILIMSDENKHITRIINENLRLCDYIESRWRETQKEVVEFSILHFGYDLKVKQTDLARMLNLSTQALNQRIQSSGYYNFIRARKEISEIINSVWVSE